MPDDRPEPTTHSYTWILEDARIRLAEMVTVERDILGHEDGDLCSWEEDDDPHPVIP